MAKATKKTGKADVKVKDIKPSKNPKGGFGGHQTSSPIKPVTRGGN